MKKNITILSLILALVFVLSGCTSTVATLSVDSRAPWGVSSNSYEQSTYSVTIKERTSVEDVMTDGDTLASGTYVTSIQNSGSIASILSTVNSSFNITWADDEKAGLNKNKSDSIISSVVFSGATSLPSTSTKTATLENRYDDNGTMQDNYSYTYSNNFSTGLSNISFGKSENASADAYTDTKQVNISSSATYDNEQLFYLLRHSSSTVAYNFNLFNAIDAYSSLSDHYHYMQVTFAEEPETITLGDFILDYTDSTEQDCLVLSLRISGYDSGYTHTFYMTDPSTSFGTGTSLATSKIIAKYEYTSYDADGIEDLHYIYELTDYVAV